MRLNRERFVELFLDQGFCIPQYMARNFENLFLKQEFFDKVIIQGVCGKTEFPIDFLSHHLNEILEKLTSMKKLFLLNIFESENKQLNLFIIFAVLMNRHKFAKMLWKRSEDPIPVRI